MLTIQPNITRPIAKMPVFRASIDEDTLRKDREFLEEQGRGFDEIIEDDKAPGYLRKFAKAFKVIVIGGIEATIVACAGIKGAKFLKSGADKFAQTSFAKGINSIAKPAKDGIKESIKVIERKGSELFKKFKETEFGQNVIKKAKYFFDETRVGKFIKRAYQYVADKLTTLYERISNKIKDITYDKAAEAVSYTAGAGAGIGAAYNSARDGSSDEVVNGRINKTADYIDIDEEDE